MAGQLLLPGWMKELTASVILALHALHLLLRSARPVSARTIHRSSRYSPDAVRRVLARLKAAGLVRGSPGRGFLPGKTAGEISVADVVRAVGEPALPKAPCGGDFDACATRASCILAPICREADQAYQNTLRSFTLAELMDVAPGVPNCMDPALRKGAS